jgi:hypothetical protein
LGVGELQIGEVLLVLEIVGVCQAYVKSENRSCKEDSTCNEQQKCQQEKYVPENVHKVTTFESIAEVCHA